MRKAARPVAVGYVRVSTPGQASEGVSLAAQRARIGAWAAAGVAELASVHEDAGLSGSKAANRPALQAALVQVCRLKGVLVVYSLSRLARSTKDALAIAERLDRAGADLVSLSEQIDTTSAAGKMVFRMLAVLAEFERDLISERTRGAMAHMRRQGRRISGRIPFGSDLVGDRLVENPEEAAVLELMRQLRADGRSLRQIAAELERRNVTAKNGGRWAPKVVSFVLRRDAEARRAA
jgi:DNA invertase Pin-like site-specific DNA recombinase